MRGTSRQSLAAVRTGWEPVVAAAGGDALGLAEQLYALVDALDASGALRRALADPSIPAQVKAGVVQRLLVGRDPRVVTVAEQVVSRWWSTEADMAQAVGELALDAVLGAADATGDLDRLETELLDVTHAFAGQRELRRTLHDVTIPGDLRADLVTGIVGEVAPTTLVVLRRAAGAPRGRRFVTTLGDVVEAIAERRNRQVATVTTAAPLDAAQQHRLEGVLAGVLGRAVQLNVVVDPRVIGGLRVQSGPDVIDATVLARLADARRALAG